MQTILLVDENHAHVSPLANALALDGFHVIVATSSALAREALAYLPIDLAIVDLMLRSEAGQSCLGLVREIKTTCPLSRVLLTGDHHVSERQLERADCGICGFVPKPYVLDEVVSLVHATLTDPPSSRRLWHPEITSASL